MTDFPFPDVDFNPEDILNREIVPHNKASTERSLARRLALQALYEVDSSEHPTKDVIAHFLSKDVESLSFSDIIDIRDGDHDRILDMNDLIETRIAVGEEEQRVIRYFIRLVSGINQIKEMLDGLLQTYAPDFPIDQVAIVDRNILRIALFEIGVEKNIPVSVAIDEAIELSKLFGADGTSRFVNGVLGTIASNLVAVRAVLVIPVDDDVEA